MIKNHIIDFIKFRRVEIIIFFVFLLFGGFPFLMPPINQESFMVQEALILLVSYIFITKEHKYQILLNKENNKLIIVEKAFGWNFYKVKSQIALDEVKRVYTVSFYSLWDRILFLLLPPWWFIMWLLKADAIYQLFTNIGINEIKTPLNFLTKDRKFMKNIEARINDFLLSKENILTITYEPIFLKIIGYTFLGTYILIFLLCYDL